VSENVYVAVGVCHEEMVARQRESSGGIQLRDEVGVNGNSRGGIVFAYCAAAVVRYKEVVARQYKRGRSVQPHDEKVGVDRDARGGVVFAQNTIAVLADIGLPAEYRRFTVDGRSVVLVNGKCMQDCVRDRIQLVS
jgi:hypothetical protein